MGVLKVVMGVSTAVATTLLFRRAKSLQASAERKEKLRTAYRDAAADPAYQVEMAEITRAFDATVADGLEPGNRVRRIGLTGTAGSLSRGETIFFR